MRLHSLIWLAAFGISAHAITLGELFTSLKSSPAIIQDRLSVEESEKATEVIHGSLYPKVYGFASIEHYSNPTNLRPFLPTESAALLSQNGTLPFSRNIAKVGLKGSMPLYNGSLYALIDELKMTHKSLQSQKRLDMLSKEAELVDSNAALIYLEHFTNALDSQNTSIQKTKERIDVGVKNGRYAQAESLKLQNALSSLRISIEDTTAKRMAYAQQIRALTNLEITQSIPMNLKGAITTSSEDVAFLEPFKQRVEAKTYASKVAERSLLPVVTADATLFRGWGEAYNNEDNFHQDYGVVGIYVNVPLFDASNYKSIEKSHLATLQAQNALEQKRIELSAKIKTLHSDENSLINSLSSAKMRVASSDELLTIGKLALQNGRLSVEEYLRYEDALLDAKATQAAIEWKLWRTRSAIAIIYGIDLADIME